MNNDIFLINASNQVENGYWKCIKIHINYNHYLIQIIICIKNKNFSLESDSLDVCTDSGWILISQVLL